MATSPSIAELASRAGGLEQAFRSLQSEMDREWFTASDVRKGELIGRLRQLVRNVAALRASVAASQPRLPLSAWAIGAHHALAKRAGALQSQGEGLRRYMVEHNRRRSGPPTPRHGPPQNEAGLLGEALTTLGDFEADEMSAWDTLLNGLARARRAAATRTGAGDMPPPTRRDGAAAHAQDRAKAIDAMPPTRRDGAAARARDRVKAAREAESLDEAVRQLDGESEHRRPGWPNRTRTRWVAQDSRRRTSVNRARLQHRYPRERALAAAAIRPAVERATARALARVRPSTQSIGFVASQVLHSLLQQAVADPTSVGPGMIVQAGIEGILRMANDRFAFTDERDIPALAQSLTQALLADLPVTFRAAAVVAWLGLVAAEARRRRVASTPRRDSESEMTW